MRVDADLRLVLPLDEGLYAYHTPITEEIFRANFRVIANTKAAIWSKGLAYAADVGPQIASLILIDEGEQLARERLEEGDYGVRSLLSEIKRLTTVLKPTDAGWDYVPVDGALDEATWREVESRVVFFTCLYALTPHAGKETVAQAIAGILNGRITSLPATGLKDFLQTWIAESASADEG